MTLNFIEKRAISSLTTFGIGGPALFSCDVKTIPDMQKAIQECLKRNIPYLILGKGSNCLFDDRGLNGALIVNKIDFLQEIEANTFYVGAGYSFSRLGTLTAKRGLTGLEYAAGIPGSVGGALFMNAGANGKETKDHLIQVEFVDHTGNLICYKKEELSFSYRHSSFHEKKGAIVSATFKLEAENGARARQIALIDKRKNSQPLQDQSAGCVFRNPPQHFAGALIEQSGLKGLRVGGAEVSPMHGNYLVNRGGATAADVLKLIALIQELVHSKTGIKLETEVRVIPYEL